MIKKKVISIILLTVVFIVSMNFSFARSQFNELSKSEEFVDVIYVEAFSDDIIDDTLVNKKFNVREKYSIKDLNPNKLINDKIILRTDDTVYNYQKSVKQLYENGNVIAFTGENIDHKKLTAMLELPLELEYDDIMYAISFKKNNNGSSIISIISEGSNTSADVDTINSLLMIALEDIDKNQIQNDMNVTVQSTSEGLLSTVTDYKNFNPYGIVVLKQDIYQGPTASNTTHFLVYNEGTTQPGKSAWGNQWKNYLVQQRIEYGNPDGGSILSHEWFPKTGKSTEDYIDITIPIKYGTATFQMAFTRKGSWISGSGIDYASTPPYAFWNTSFSSNGPDESNTYNAKGALTITNPKGHRIRALSRYTVTFTGGGTRSETSLVGVTVYPFP